MQVFDINRRCHFLFPTIAENINRPFEQLILSLFDLIGVNVKLL
jgi:hypothetical protein